MPTHAYTCSHTHVLPAGHKRERERERKREEKKRRWLRYSSFLPFESHLIREKRARAPSSWEKRRRNQRKVEAQRPTQ
jgi:hypothetical protein